jgi:c-di-GMP-binding flagellar brake protein YcgR
MDSARLKWDAKKRSFLYETTCFATLESAGRAREDKESIMIECRQYPRVPVDLQVYFSTTGNTSIREGTMFDLSAGGCAVASMSAVRPGSAVRILIRATDLGSPITIESAAVRWSQHGEFGVEFLGVSEIDQNRLHRLLQAKTSHTIRPS